VRRRQERHGGAWRHFTSVASGEGSRPSFQARLGATCSREHAHMPRGSGEKLGRPRQPVPEGGGSASPASSWGRCCAQGKGKRAGQFCSPRRDTSKTSTGEEGAAAAVISYGKRSSASAGCNTREKEWERKKSSSPAMSSSPAAMAE
jgi:hypothetical protein